MGHRLRPARGRKAVVLFARGHDYASRFATAATSLRGAEGFDAPVHVVNTADRGADPPPAGRSPPSPFWGRWPGRRAGSFTARVI